MFDNKLIELQNGDRVLLESCHWLVCIEKDNQKILVRDDGLTYGLDNWNKYGNVKENSSLDKHWYRFSIVQRMNNDGIYNNIWKRKEFQTEKHVSLVIDARFNVLVETDNLRKAYDKAKEKWEAVIFETSLSAGELKTVDVKLEHIEDEDGKYYYEEDLERM